MNANESSCPEATRDRAVHLANLQTAISDASYGHRDTQKANASYWKRKASQFDGDVQSAKKALCGNCVAFNQTDSMLQCISMSESDDENSGSPGFCEVFDFACGSERTCDAWESGALDSQKKRDTFETTVTARLASLEEALSFLADTILPNVRSSDDSDEYAMKDEYDDEYDDYVSMFDDVSSERRR